MMDPQHRTTGGSGGEAGEPTGAGDSLPLTFTFTFICHPGKTHNLRSRGDTSRRAQT